MKQKYYYNEHESAYQVMKREHILAWDEYHDPQTYSFDHFMMRPFLEQALEQLIEGAVSSSKTAFEYGCGTGAGAVFLAERGYEVEAVDISPTAISIAKELARERKLNIHYSVQDLLLLSSLGKQYDVILDNYCLQSIVTDKDREHVFMLVRTGLKQRGHYILSSAVFEAARSYADDQCYFDEETAIMYDRVEDGEAFEDSLFLGGKWWIPNRRHLRPERLREELEKAGFHIVYQDKGNVICRNP